MKIICAWCGAIIKDGTEEIVSHGICRPCEDKACAEIKGEDEDEQAQPH